MACLINARGRDFSFPRSELSKRISRDLERYSTFFPDDSSLLGVG